MSKEKPEEHPFDVIVAVPEPKPTTGDAAPAPEIPTTDAMRRLATYVEDQFRINRDHRAAVGVNESLEYAARCQAMKFSPRQEQILRDCRIDPKNYPPLTLMKNTSCKALLDDIVSASGNKPYVLNPTPRPELPKSVRKKIMRKMAEEIVKFYQKIGGPIANANQLQAFYASIVVEVSKMYDALRHEEMSIARERCDRMDQLIHDQLVEGHFIQAFREAIGYLTTYGTALIVGPCPRVESKCENVEVEGYDDAYKYKRTYKVIPTYEAVSPWDCYPAPNAKRVDEGALCIKVRYTSNALWQYAEAMEGKDEKPDGWQPNTVRALLSRYPHGGCRLPLEAYDMVRREVENDVSVGTDDCTLEGIRCFSSIRGSELISFGIFKTPTDEQIEPSRYYKTETIVIGGYVVYCRVVDDCMEMPVVKAVLYDMPGSWWGDSIAHRCVRAQSMQNNAMKDLTVNTATAAHGMYYCKDVNSVVSLDGSPALALRAGKMFGFRQTMLGREAAPIGEIPVKDMTASLLKVLEEAAKLADDDTCIPQYTIGSANMLGSGAGRTASGLSMMQESASRIIKMCVVGLGNDVIIPVVRNTYAYNLLHGDDMSVRGGDVDVAPSGLMGRIFREAESQRRQQMTAMLGQHPVLSQAMTVESFFELLRPELEGIGVNPDKIIPSKERMEFIQKLVDITKAQQAAQGAQDGGGEQPDGSEPTQQQQVTANVEGNPQGVAAAQGKSVPGSVAERRGAA